MSSYREIKVSTQELYAWYAGLRLHIKLIGNRVATKRDIINRVKLLAIAGLPFPPLALAEYVFEGA